MNSFPGWKTCIRTVALWCLTALIVALGSYYVAPLFKTSYEAHAQVNVRPFTLQREHYGFDENHPNGWLGLKETVARASNGGLARVNHSFDPGGSWGEIRAVELADGSNALVYDDTGTVVRGAKPPDWLIAMRKEAMTNAVSKCIPAGATVIGSDKVDGYDVTVVRVHQTDNTRITVSLAPSLGCERVQSLGETQQGDGSYKIVSKTTLVSVVVGEPDRQLFDIPASYQPAMPSEALRNEVAFLGRPWDSKLESIAHADDVRFVQHQEGHWGAPPKNRSSQPNGATP